MSAGKFELPDMEPEYTSNNDEPDWDDLNFSNSINENMLAEDPSAFSNSILDFNTNFGSNLDMETPPVFAAQTPSRDRSPAANAESMFNTNFSSQNGPVFSTPSSDSSDTFDATRAWPHNLNQNPQWPGADPSSQFTSPNAVFNTPSPVVANGITPAKLEYDSLSAQANALTPDRALDDHITMPAATPGGYSSRLRVAPISTKSRVETQINVGLTLELPPPNVEYIHLPEHTVAKSKLLAKEEVDETKALELGVMLVCTSAMHNPDFKKKAMQRAAAADNDKIQQRAKEMRDMIDDDKNDPKNVPDEEKPANGGEVRICSNCMQRERKRAGRKKVKKDEEVEHWERFETERVVVFNSNEFLAFKPYEPGSMESQREHGSMGEQNPYIPPDGSLHTTANMRIACYCRHQSEKEGFRVIFTLKDRQGRVVAQEISDSILITDDHKTHPQAFNPALPEGVPYPGQFYAAQQQQFTNAQGLPVSYSMTDLTQPMQQFHSSRSAGNLQSLGYGAQQPVFNPHSHVHQLPQGGNAFASQGTSTTMTPSAILTPTNLSRPGSPTFAGQSGPHKKRKSSSFHKRVPSGLQMTPRVDTNQGQQMSDLMAAASLTSPFSPTSAGYNNQPQTDYMSLPQANATQQFLGSGPPTPAMENGAFMFGHGPSPAVGPAARLTRENTSNMQAFYSAPSSRHQSRASSPVRHGASHFNFSPQQHQLAQHAAQQLMGHVPGAQSNLHNSQTQAQVQSQPQAQAQAQFQGQGQAQGGRQGRAPDPRMMEMALRVFAQEKTGNPDNWLSVAQNTASQYVQQNMHQAGINDPGS